MIDVLRIAMDIGTIAAWQRSPMGKVGITRAIEALGQALGARSDVRVTLAGLGGGEPLYYSYLVTLFPRHEWGATIGAESTVRSRFGLDPLHRRLMPAYLNDLAQGLGSGDRLPLRSTLLRGSVKALKIADARPHFDANKFGVFLPDGDYLLTLAAFQPRKNVPRLLRAFGRLLTAHPDLPVSLVMAGKPGPSTDEIDAALESLGAARNRVVTTGYVAEEDLSALYSGARVFIFPSLAEGFGLPPLEAMCCRVPVITSTATSLPEVVGDTALLVDPTDEDSLYRAMRDLLADKERARDLAQAGWEHAQGYTWANNAALLVEALRRVKGVPCMPLGSAVRRLRQRR